MNENHKLILTAIISLVIGAGASMAVAHHDRDWNEHRMSDRGMTHNDMTMSGEMNGMTQGLSGKTGDEFDKAFLSEMITHHEGAVEMAQSALQNAKHQEIKDLAQKIITAQNTEIKEMQDWQKSWYMK